jgi:hypothetical protein
MPFKSEDQRKFMWANHPKIARRWTNEGYAEGGAVMDDKMEGGPMGGPDESKGSTPIAAVLLRMKKEGKPMGQEAPVDMPPGEAGEESGEQGDLQMASEDLAAAVKSGDPKSIASAFQSMFDLCMARRDMGGDEDMHEE